MPNTLPALIAQAVRERGPQPLVTFYGVDGERTELSYATLDNWASKTANWLVEELGAERGGIVAVAAVPDWRCIAAVAGCWKAGVGADLGSEDGETADDHVLAFADDYDDPEVDAGEPALRLGARTWTQRELLADAGDVARRSRVATSLAPGDPALWLLVTGVLAARGALVWSPGADADTLARRADQERAGQVLP